ncbi:ComEC/Rec2 family competence protein [Mycoplasmopsis citelli]|uniref:ComEC/Rec2 family competence protein n=1 Tax=Mycoplasmopsis citelli TaxID=171281 RepID=UPI0021145CF1|nr:ComEC/Rec2 family competence protein [Mycoplasmopsis citelli]UUD36538.1 ComEC/Rec2 family competence protein [Mycoplasmopsis citelli]
MSVQKNEQIFILNKISPKTLIFQDQYFRNYLVFKKQAWNSLILNAKYLITSEIEQLNPKYNFFKTQGVFHQLNIISLQFYKHTPKSWFFNLEIFQYQKFNQIVKTLLFGYSNSEIIGQYNFLGIVHLVVLSGMHFNLIMYFLKTIFKKIKSLIFLPLIIVLVYFFFCNWTVSSIKAIFLIIFTEIYTFKHNQVPQDLKLKALVAVSLGVLAINPWYSYSLGFWFSFLLSGFIYLKINKSLTVKQFIADYFNIWLFSALLVFIFAQKFYPLSFIISLIITPIIEICVFLLFFSFWISPFVLIINSTFDYFTQIFVFASFYIVFEINNLYLYWSIKIANFLAIYGLLIRKLKFLRN